MPPADNPEPSKHKLRLSLDLRVVVMLLLAVIGVMLFLWKPWDSSTSSDRTISVTGEATLKAEPDEYLFYPSYEFTNSDKDAALSALTKKSSEIVAKLKDLGVADSKIKTNASGYSKGIYLPAEGTSDSTYNLSLTVTVADKGLAQKVQDYLLTTKPSGAVTPQPNFSEAKRKQLESQARGDATKDARAKAEQSAKNLGFNVANVKSVADGSGFGYPLLDGTNGAEPARDASVSPKLDIQPGENELHYYVTVVYYIR